MRGHNLGSTKNTYWTILGHNVQKPTDFSWHKHVQTYMGARDTDKKWVCPVWGALILIFVHIDSGSKRYVVFLPLHPVWLTFMPWPPRRFRASIHYGQVIKARFVPRYIAMVVPRTEIQLPTEQRVDRDKRARTTHNRFFFLTKRHVYCTQHAQGIQHRVEYNNLALSCSIRRGYSNISESTFSATFYWCFYC